MLNHMLDGEKNESVIVNGLSVIQTLLEFKKMGYVLVSGGLSNAFILS